jgi:hypothetical protein
VDIIVLDAGPTPHGELIRFDDPDIEDGLEQNGYSSEGALYRLLKIDLRKRGSTRVLRPNEHEFG